ncbi:hypothetical protein [Streptosporangium sp. NPDC006930]|uniref:hypothetical protein n=1 Tax=unclassified Streptosporangium TaxID=2632669 RepID=UPI003412A0F2
MASILACAAAAAAWKASIVSLEAGGAAGSLASAEVAGPPPAGPAVLPEGAVEPPPPAWVAGPGVRPRGTAGPVAALGTAVPGGWAPGGRVRARMEAASSSARMAPKVTVCSPGDSLSSDEVSSGGSWGVPARRGSRPPPG